MENESIRIFTHFTLLYFCTILFYNISTHTHMYVYTCIFDSDAELIVVILYYYISVLIYSYIVMLVCSYVVFVYSDILELS